jgi:hypothetical protein
MRWPVLVCSLVLVASACKKANKPAEGSGSESSAGGGSAVAKAPPTADTADTPVAVPTPPPAPGLVELLHNAPSVVRVSSRVQNKTIQPEHIVDKNLNTAWNSRTGELQGAWIDVDVGGAQIKEIRMTIGHTGKGVHGEDYFTMNPRIKTVSVRDGEKLVAQKTLDTDKRELQPIVLATPASHVRIKVEDVVMGAKPSWRETCVSEIEAWGTLPAGATAAPQKPRIEVGDPPDDSWAKAPISDADGYCQHVMKDLQAEYKKQMDAINKDNEECIKQHGDSAGSFCGNPDPPGAPDCSMAVTMPVKVNHSTWMGAGVMSSTNDSVYGARPTQLVVETQEGFWPVGEEIDCGSFGANGHCSLEVTSASVAKSGDLDVGYHLHTWDGDKDFTMTCNAAPNVTCTKPAEAKPAATP